MSTRSIIATARELVGLGIEVWRAFDNPAIQLRHIRYETAERIRKNREYADEARRRAKP